MSGDNPHNGTPASGRAVRIALDATGGDRGPTETVQGALQAVRELGVHVILVGDEDAIKTAFQGESLPEQMTVVHAPETVTMDDDPVRAVRQKRNSSIVVAARLVRAGEADALVSAGNTGATMAAGLFHIGRAPGVERPAIATPMPTGEGFCFIVDAGANAEARPEHLHQFAHMGAVYVREVFNVEQPRVGLLNVGAESSKGTKVVRDAYDLLRDDTGIRFVGNVEGNDVPAGAADVVVCDGFTGNVVLKFAEGVASTVFHLLRRDVFAGGRGAVAGMLVRPGLRSVRDRLDYAEYGGAPLLGVSGTVIIAHGRSDRRAIRNAINAATVAARHDVPGRIGAAMAALSVE